jgi:hypothetical protein
MIINSFFNTVSVSRYSRPITNETSHVTTHATHSDPWPTLARSTSLFLICHKTSHMVLSIIFLEDKHKMLLHLSIFYEYQQFFQHRICFSIQPPDYQWDKSRDYTCYSQWPVTYFSTFYQFILNMLFKKQYIIDHYTCTTAKCIFHRLPIKNGNFPVTFRWHLIRLKDVSYKLQLKWHAIPKWSSTKCWQMGGKI